MIDFSKYHLDNEEIEFINDIKEDINTIEKISEYFNVSTLAVRVRAKQLNLKGHGL